MAAPPPPAPAGPSREGGSRKGRLAAASDSQALTSPSSSPGLERPYSPARTAKGVQRAPGGFPPEPDWGRRRAEPSRPLRCHYSSSGSEEERLNGGVRQGAALGPCEATYPGQPRRPVPGFGEVGFASLWCFPAENRSLLSGAETEELPPPPPLKRATWIKRASPVRPPPHIVVPELKGPAVGSVSQPPPPWNLVLPAWKCAFFLTSACRHLRA